MFAFIQQKVFLPLLGTMFDCYFRFLLVGLNV
jgi:hypothetical protein